MSLTSIVLRSVASPALLGASLWLMPALWFRLPGPEGLRTTLAVLAGALSLICVIALWWPQLHAIRWRLGGQLSDAVGRQPRLVEQHHPACGPRLGAGGRTSGRGERQPSMTSCTSNRCATSSGARLRITRRAGRVGGLPSGSTDLGGSVDQSLEWGRRSLIRWSASVSPMDAIWPSRWKSARSVTRPSRHWWVCSRSTNWW